MQSEIISTENLIVGSGAGGATLAYQLAKAGREALIIEEAREEPKTTYPECVAFEFATRWRNGGISAAFGKPMIAYAEGKAAGGGTAINTAIWQIPPTEIIDNWVENYRFSDFSQDQFLRYLEKASKLALPVYPDVLASDAIPLQNGAEALGWKHSLLPIAGEKISTPTGTTFRRRSLYDSLVRPFLGNNVRFLRGVRALKLDFEGETVVGVHVENASHSQCKFIKAKYVFLAGGAIQTPALLLRSGVRKNVGKSLSLHPTIRAIGLFKEAINSNPTWVPACAVTEFMPDMRIGGSVFNPTYFAMALAEDWEHRSHLLQDMERCGLYYVMITPSSNGRVFLNPLNKTPVVKFQLNDSDLKALWLGTHRLRNVMKAGGAATILPSVRKFKGWTSNNPDEQIDLFEFRRFANPMTIHLFSSCPMGEAIDRCAVATNGRLHGKKNLYVSDASLLPSAPGVNPQASIMAIALRIADEFLQAT